MNTKANEITKTGADDSVPAFVARDGTLHLKKTVRDAIDARADYDNAIETIAQKMLNEAPYIDDWRAHAISTVEEFKDALETVLDSTEFDSLLNARICLERAMSAASKDT